MKATLCIVSGFLLLGGAFSVRAQTPPVITVQPQDATTCDGGNASFYVEILHEPSPTYYWIWRGSIVTSGVVSTETNSSVTLSNVLLSDDLSQIYVYVLGSGGGTQSSNVLLHVPDPYFCTQPVDTGVPVGGTIQFHAFATGTGPLNYQWWFKRFATSTVQALTDDTHITGSWTPSLIITSASLTNAGTYWATVTNGFFNTVTSSVAQCSVGSPPTVSNVISRVVRVFTSTSFVPSYGGSNPKTYQWYRNDVLLPGATLPNLNLVNIQRPEVGLYHVVVSNPGGSTASSKAHLQVRLTLEGNTPVFLEEATDDLFSLTNAVISDYTPTSVFHGVPLLFTTYKATAGAGEAPHCGFPASHSMWVVYTSPRTEVTPVSTDGSDFDTVLGVYDWDGNLAHAATEIACDNNSGFDGFDSKTNFPAVVGHNYYIAVDGVGGATGTARLQVGQSIRKYNFNRTNGTFRFELAGSFWTNNVLRTSTNASSSTGWTTLLTMPATNKDWIIGYTNNSAASEPRRYYSSGVTPGTP